MSTLEVRHLRLIRAIVEEGGPTKAGARLHLTQSAVSHQLAELEARLGVALFDRVRRQLKLTPAGARLLAASRTLLTELARLESELLNGAARKREPLRLAVESFTSYHWLPKVMVGLAKEHPHVDVRVVMEATRAPLASLLRGDIELGIVSSPVRDRALAVVPLFRDEWTLILAPGHRLASLPFVRAADLATETLLAHDAPRADVQRLREILAFEHAAMPQTSIVPFTDAIVDLVKAGLGVGLVSRWAVAASLARGEVVARRFTKEGLPEVWSAVYRRDAEVRLPLARLAELIRATFPVPPRKRA